ncbi:unnamed protein product, partial [marine sediment metagenome]
MQILNQIHAATAGSIAETGEYLEPFISTAVSDIERGFTMGESLARMTAGIETTGSIAEAATMSRRLVDIAAGRTKAGLKFLTGQAKKRDVDFGALTDPQRFEFVRGLYHEFQKAGTMDVLKTKLDVRGFAAMRALFSEVGERKYFGMLPVIEEAAGGTAVQQMAEQYKGLLTAEKTQIETRGTLAKARTGREQKEENVLWSMMADAHDIARTRTAGFGGFARLALTPEYLEKRNILRMIVRENLAL